MNTLSTVGQGSDGHVFVIRDGRIFYRIRYPTGDWSKWTELDVPEGQRFEEVSSFVANNQLHVIAANQDGAYFHDIKYVNGDWQGMFQMPE
jgi:hypothetical protein